MNKALSIFAFLLIVTVIGTTAAFLYGYKLYYQPGPLTKETVIEIPRGAGAGTISHILAEERIIGQPLFFRLAVRLRQDTLKAGEYLFASGISMADAMDKLVKGEIYQRQITIPEGLTSWQIVQLLNKEETLQNEKITKIPPEGSLLPETYNYTAQTNRAALIEIMQEAMARTLEALWAERADNLPFETREEAVTLASIVEKETGLAAERARIAGVFVNRLRIGMGLQSDPTVIYALTAGEIEDKGQGPIGRRLLRKDLTIDSAYNTYKYAGLPPGPIANPGRDALAAVLKPEEHDYFYFVADGTGAHVFSKTLEEHNRNAAKWRKIRAEKGL